MKYGFQLLIIFQTLYLNGQIPGINMDTKAFFQLYVKSLNQDEGAKIHLGDVNDDVFLRLYSDNKDAGIEDPMISRTQERALIFAIEDYGANSQEQMRLSPEGKLIVKNLGGSTTRNVVVTDDGTLKAQSVDIYAGVKTLTAYDFVSESNPGEDHNVVLPSRTVYHETIIQGMESLISPIDLPHLSRIKRIDVRYRDFNLSDSIRVELEIDRNAGPFVGPVLIGHSQVGGDSMSMTMDVQIDNVQHTYFIRAFNPNDVTAWPGSDVGIWTATIYYNLE